MHVILLLIVQFAVINESYSLKTEKWCDPTQELLPNMINSIVQEVSRKTNKCIVFILDQFYHRVISEFNGNQSKLVSYYVIAVRDSDAFDSPRRRIHAMLTHSKNSGCDAYVILIANGLRIIELLKYAERERLLNIQGYFLLMHDERILNPEMKYIWNRVINVVFIRQLNSLKQRSGETIREEWFNLETIIYPIQDDGLVATHYIDTWYNGRFRYTIDHFPNKTNDLSNKKLKVAIFEHIPAVTKHSRRMYIGDQTYTDNALGIEFEIIRIVADNMNFHPVFYRPPNIEIDKWGTSDDNGSYNGLLGEAMRTNAAFLLGNFHYTLRHHSLLELSYPYNTECLTFLTPESLYQNSWKLLIIPFTLYTWIAVIMILLVGAYVLHLFALFYLAHIMPLKKRKTENISGVVMTSMKRTRQPQELNHTDEQSKGLVLFTEMQNGLLYTYGMLLQVSLPRLPRAWALRLFIGWWWIYSILVTVVYRASMTATLANPVARVTINTLAELAKSSISVGGWGEDKRELFISSSDKDLQKIGEKFELLDNADTAIARIANGTFGYYENIYFLQDARAKRQLFEALQNKKAAENNENLILDRDLHIMQECVINMPVSIGMDRNSPLKSRVDQLVRRIIESGLVEKWLSDVMEWSKIAETRFDYYAPKALIDLHKLYGALIALAIGYFLGFGALAAENLYWKFIVMKDPAYDKYRMDVFYAQMKQTKK